MPDTTILTSEVSIHFHYPLQNFFLCLSFHNRLGCPHKNFISFAFGAFTALLKTIPVAWEDWVAAVLSVQSCVYPNILLHVA